ncbi:MAG: hypothetical protein HND48_02500 [Chloroflexi bacterium]|nr:hypothetical protein [Chloroflexota bacterium]
MIDEAPSYDNGGIVITDEGTQVIKFTIADWAVWSDGTPITAADFVLPYEIANDGVSQVLAFRMLGGLAGSVAQGETEKDVVVTFDAPNPDWQYAAIVPLPNHILREGVRGGSRQRDRLRAEQLGSPTDRVERPVRLCRMGDRQLPALRQEPELLERRVVR